LKARNSKHEAHGAGNPKHEARNPKQIQNSNEEMTETGALRFDHFFFVL
jgi:hypothetical protein